MWTHVVGYAVFGVAARCYALGIQRRPLFHYPQWHAVAAMLGAGVGYLIGDAQVRHEQMIQHRLHTVRQRRTHFEQHPTS